MKIALDVEPEVLERLERLGERQNRSVESIAQDVLRNGLAAEPSRGSRTYETPARDLGRCLIDNLDDVAGALAQAEGEDFQ